MMMIDDRDDNDDVRKSLHHIALYYYSCRNKQSSA